MTIVKLEKDGKNFHLTVEGHAGYEEEGKDIVCCAISLLFYLAKDHCVNDYVREEKGNCELKTHGSESYKILKLIMHGYRILSWTYPEYIQVLGAL